MAWACLLYVSHNSAILAEHLLSSGLDGFSAIFASAGLAGAGLAVSAIFAFGTEVDGMLRLAMLAQEVIDAID